MEMNLENLIEKWQRTYFVQQRLAHGNKPTQSMRLIKMFVDDLIKLQDYMSFQLQQMRNFDKNPILILKEVIGK